MTIQYTTAGESHGPQLTAITSGVPAGLKISTRDINRDLARR
ncbi:MAG: chorismate synthase, partial [Thermoleophilia bacterium]